MTQRFDSVIGRFALGHVTWQFTFNLTNHVRFFTLNPVLMSCRVYLLCHACIVLYKGKYSAKGLSSVQSMSRDNGQLFVSRGQIFGSCGKGQTSVNRWFPPPFTPTSSPNICTSIINSNCGHKEKQKNDDELFLIYFQCVFYT